METQENKEKLKTWESLEKRALERNAEEHGSDVEMKNVEAHGGDEGMQNVKEHIDEINEEYGWGNNKCGKMRGNIDIETMICE